MMTFQNTSRTEEDRLLHYLSPSDLIKHDKRGRMVSNYSYWHDEEWVFEISTPGQATSINRFNFKILLRPATNEYESDHLTSPAFHKLLDETRRFIWSRMEDGTKGSSIKSGVIGSYRPEISCFLRWLASEGYTSFGDVPQGAVESSFIPFLTAELALSSDDDKHTVDTIKSYLQVPARLFEQNAVMPVSVTLLRHDPFPGSSPVKKAETLTSKVAQQVPAVPSAIFASATGAMLTWLDHVIPDILRFQNIFISADGAHGARATSHSKKNRYRDDEIRQRLISEDFACLPGESTPWRGRLVLYEANEGRHKSVGSQLRGTVLDGVSACVLTILALVGMRLSEVCGLIGSLNLANGLPDCVVIEPTLNGLFEAFYITGHIYKRRHVPQKHRWAAGLRPVGSTDLPPAILAIKRLYQLLEPWRDLARPDKPSPDQTPQNQLHNQLLVRLRYSREFPRNRDGVAPIVATRLAGLMKSWLQRHGKVPAGVNIITPAWRKSYALQTYMIDPQLLTAISKHFGHVSEMITYSSYVEGADPELERYRDDVAYNEVARYMAAVRRGEIPTAGKIPEAIVANSQYLDAHFADLSEDEIIDAMTDELRKSNIRGFGAPWGICIYRREWSRCEGSACGPNFVKRNSETCCSCANLVMLERHHDFWRDRKAKTEVSLAEFEAFDPNAGIVPVLKARLSQSDKVLSALKVAA